MAGHHILENVALGNAETTRPMFPYFRISCIKIIVNPVDKMDSGNGRVS